VRMFLCTAWRLTWSSRAMSCQDQPWSRAFSTWSASSRSSRRRKAATDRRPTAGSRLPAAAASFVASLMTSIYVDKRSLVNPG
jgi:hypothetical protein